MALDDICKNCKHQLRYHAAQPCYINVNTDPMQPPNYCGCDSFQDMFAVPEVDDDLSLGGFLADLRIQMAELNNVFAPLKAEHEAINNEIKSLEEQRLIARQKAAAVADQMRLAEKMIEKAGRAAELAERKVMQAESLRLAEAKLKELSDSFDKITGVKWREWAFDYQIDDAKVAALSISDSDSSTGKGCIIANTMGTGKTIISMITCDFIKAQRILVVTPATVMRTFKAECERWQDRKVYLVGGLNKIDRRTKIEILAAMKDMGKSFVVVLNYESMRKDSAFLEDLTLLEFDCIIMDEAHTFKDKKSLTFRQMKQLTENIPAVFPMTGSPILNKPQDLWPLLNMIDPYQFYDEYQFLRQYCVQDWETKKWRFSTTGLNGLQRKLRNKFIRRTKEQTGISLPSKTIQVHDIELDPVVNAKQFKANSDLNTQAAIFLENGDATSITTTLALITRKRQMMTLPSGIKWTDSNKDSPSYGQVIFQCDVEDSVKLDYIIHPNGDSDNPTWDDADGLLPELSSDEKVVIFSQFKAPLQELLARCQKAGILAAVIDGDTSLERRQQIIDAFQNKAIGTAGSIDVILGNYKALGVGVTLHAATQMIILDEEWSGGKNDQAYDRIHRIGQEKPVTIHILRVPNSVDEWMAQLIEDKRNMVDGFMDSVAVTSAELLDKIKGGML